MDEKDNPRVRITEKVGDIDDVEVWYHRVLIAMYVRPEQTAGGVYLPQGHKSTAEEDVWQGKVGLVLKMGVGAFVDDAENKFHGTRAKVGDWVIVKPNDGWVVKFNEHHCKFVEDNMIIGRLARPDRLF